MVLGLTPEAYAVFACGELNSDSLGAAPVIASLNETLLVFTAFQDAKDAAEDYIASFPFEVLGGGIVYCPKYVWISPISKLWIDGED